MKACPRPGRRRGYSASDGETQSTTLTYMDPKIAQACCGKLDVSTFELISHVKYTNP